MTQYIYQVYRGYLTNQYRMGYLVFKSPRRRRPGDGGNENDSSTR